MSPRTRSRTLELVAGTISALLAIAALYGVWALFGHLAERRPLAELRAERAAAATWPVVEGRLERLTVNGSRAGRGTGRLYGAEATYRYEVAGKSYEGSRVGFDWHVSHSSEFSDFRTLVAAIAPSVDLALFVDSPSCAHLAAYESCSYDYTPDAPVRVHYDPRAPGNAVLEPRDLVPLGVLEHWVQPLAWVVVLLALAIACTLSTWLMLRSSELPPAPVLSARATAFWALALGLLFLALPLEYYVSQLGWRGALDDSGRTLAWAVGFGLMMPLGLFGIWLFSKGLRGLFRASEDGEAK